MREMKDSGVEWIGEIPKDWKVFHYKHIVEQTIDNRGRTPEVNEKREGIPLFELDSIGNRNPDFTKVSKYISKDSYEKFIRNDLKKGDVLFGTVGSVGKLSILETDDLCCIAQNIVGYRFKKEHNSLYWYFYFQSELFKQMYMQFNKGNIQSSIKISDMANGYVVVPPLISQNRMADYLDTKCSQIDSIIEKQQAIIEKLKEYKLSVITEAVTKGLNPDVEMKDSGIAWIGKIPKHWKIGKVKNGTSKVGSGKTPKGGAEIYASSGILFLRSQNVYDDGLVLDEPTYITDEIDEEMSNTRVYPGDVLLNITGGSIGRCCIFPKEAERANVNQHVAIIRVKDNVFTPEYMHYYWNSEKGKIAISFYQTGGNREGMSGEAINNTPIPIPSIDEQKIISKFIGKRVNEIVYSIERRKSIIEKLQEYKKSLIYEVVTGKKEV